MDVLKGIPRRTARETANRERRCMNCGEIIAHNATDVYSRRFCSERCKEEYLYKSES